MAESRAAVKLTEGTLLLVEKIAGTAIMQATGRSALTRGGVTRPANGGCWARRSAASLGRAEVTSNVEGHLSTTADVCLPLERSN